MSIRGLKPHMIIANEYPTIEAAKSASEQLEQIGITILDEDGTPKTMKEILNETTSKLSREEK